MGEACRRLDVPLLDLTDAIGEGGGEKLFIDGIHFTPEGHRLAAQQVGRWIESLPVFGNIPRP